MSGGSFLRMLRPARWLEAGRSPPAALRRRQARSFTAELAPARFSPGQGLLSLLGLTIPCRGRTSTGEHVKG